ncbi:MAG: extracellular solute-binding protein [Actinobacteria bacterium]|nr:extracellular solute-binding protein [Actinomycetota bacterium]
MRRSWKTATAIAVVVGVAIPLAACSGGSGSGDSGQITLNVGLFGSFGYKEAGLYAAYEKAHPNIKIVETSPQNETDYWSALQTHLAGNSGLADIQAIEVGRLAGVKANLANKFADLSTLEGWSSYSKDFLAWKLDLAKTKDGAQVATGTDIGPLALCYRPDAFKAAGLPTDPTEVAKLWSGGWSDYVKVGDEVKSKLPSGMKWTDSGAGLFRAAMGVTGEKYTDPDGKLIWDSSDTVQTSWDLGVKAIEDGLTTSLTQFSQEWNQGFTTNAFATIPCPGWMLTYIKGQAGDSGNNQWSVATSPAAGNVGGSYLAIPTASQHQKEAWDLVKFLTSAASMQKVFEQAGNFPSNTGAISAIGSYTDPYFNGASTGKILGDSAASLPTPQVIGVHDGDIETAVMNGLNEVAQKGVSADKAWSNVKAAVKAAVG